MPKQNTDYSKTIIYKIVCNNLNIKELYVGHTTDFTKRKYGHKDHCCGEKYKNHNLKVYKHIRENGGWDNWSMIEVEKYPCADGNEARARERYWIETLNAVLNCTSPFQTQEEQKELKKKTDKEYAIKNKETIKEYKHNYHLLNRDAVLSKAKEYRENNPEQKKESNRVYRLNNLDKIKERKTAPYTCECGCIIQVDKKARHLKSKKHLRLVNIKNVSL